MNPKKHWGNFKPLIPLLSFILFGLLPNLSLAFCDLGIPVREAICWKTFVGPGKTGKWDTIYLSFGQYQAPLFLLSVNPDTKEVRQFKGPLSSEMGSWGFTFDREGRIYLGTYYGAHLLRFDPRTEQWEDLGQPAGEKESFICSLTTDPDGKVWGGTFPSAKLFSYDPKTGLTQEFGRMDPDQFYCYPIAGEDGLIYCSIQFEKMNIVVFDPKSKTKTSLLSPEERKAGRIRLIKGTDGKIYAKISPLESWFRIEEGKRLIPFSESNIPFPLYQNLPDGRAFYLVDHKRIRIQNPEDGGWKEIPLHYEASGSCIFTLAVGPEGRIYGSSMLPLRLFVFDPENLSLLNLGRAAYSDGEIYSMGTYKGKLYLCSYPEGRLSVYDPNKPLRFGQDDEANPRDLGPMGEGQYRPRAMVAGPHGKIYIGGYPDYGQLGGSLSIYVPEKKEKRNYRHLIENQSIASLAYIEKLDLLAIGSSIRGGSGTHPIEEVAKLGLWDPKEEKKVFETIPVSGAKTILSLAVTFDGLLYGITDNQKVFVFDPERREVKKVLSLEFEKPLEVSLQLGPDQKLYGLAKEAIFTIDPKKDQIYLIGTPPSPITSGMAIRGWKIYYGSGPHLYEFEIPIAETKRVD